ncbi:MAG TPA: hypothetical protein P5102_15770 [Candidatus Competibacteraceae bacterium]|nr:hypothetical protein [Candidatus Competibacteraceae bacterium]
MLLLGERGGSASYPQGRLYWGVFDPAVGTLFWPPAGQAGVAVNPPGPWLNPREKRVIADLYLDANGVLWAVASEDGGDQGPFRSVVYRATTVRLDRDPPVAIHPKPRHRLASRRPESRSVGRPRCYPRQRAEYRHRRRALRRRLATAVSRPDRGRSRIGGDSLGASRRGPGTVNP